MKKILLIICALITVLFFPIGVHASGEAELQGEASILNTEGSLTFEDNNSSVTVNPETGNIAGYAWSEDLGWIDFDNNGEEDSTRIDLETGSISGLAYVLNTDGQIDFSNYDRDVTIDIETGDAAGYAWSEDIGWVDFAGVSLSVNLTGELTETGVTTIYIQIIALCVIAIFSLKRKLYLNF